MIYTIGGCAGSSADFANFSKDAKELPSLDKNLKAIWLGNWSLKNSSITQQVNVNGNRVEIKLIAEIDENLHNLRFEVGKNSSTRVTKDAETLVAQLNDRLVKICAEIFAHNKMNLKSVKVLPNGDFFYKADIYGKIVSPETAEREGLRKIGMAKYELGKISQMTLIFEKIMGYFYKKASNPSLLRSEIFKLVSSGTVDMWDAANKV